MANVNVSPVQVISNTGGGMPPAGMKLVGPNLGAVSARTMPLAGDLGAVSVRKMQLAGLDAVSAHPMHLAGLGIETARTVPLAAVSAHPMQLTGLGAVSVRSMQLAAAKLTDEQIAAQATEIAKQLAAFPPLTLTALADIFAALDKDTRTKLSSAIIAAGGDAGKVGNALDIAKWKAIKKSKYAWAWGLLSTASGAASAYHGYKRNDSIGWALGWFVLGSVFPIITPTIAVAQGFAQPK